MLTTKIVEEKTVMVLKEIYDPELPVNIYDLGLIYFVVVKESISNEQEFFVNVEMTVTSPNCPAIESLPQDIIDGVERLESVIKCDVEVTFDPPWDKSFMSEEAKLELGFL
tara:strand:+ start:7571 stop:7903 length:333 start_codon:yes stop_codon:yes gene_type:complete